MNKLARAVLSGLTSLFFIGILIFAMVAFTDISGSDIYVSAIIFQLIGYLTLLIFTVCHYPLSEKIGHPQQMALVFLAIVYVVIVYILSLVTYAFISTSVFVLINLIVLFVYFGISTVLITNGISNKKS